MTKALTAADYKVIQNADLFVAALATGSSVPETMTVTANGAVSANATSITVDALSDPMYEGQQLKFGAVTVRLTADAAANATSLSIEPASGIISDNATATTYVLSPIYAVQTFNRDSSEDSESFSTFNTEAGFKEELILGRSNQISCKGYTVSGNPGLTILKAANNGIGKNAQVYFEFIDDADEGYKGFGNVKGFKETNEVNKAVEISWNFGVSGKLYDLSETIS
jgi:hypothetical protein